MRNREKLVVAEQGFPFPGVCAHAGARAQVCRIESAKVMNGISPKVPYA